MDGTSSSSTMKPAAWQGAHGETRSEKDSVAGHGTHLGARTLDGTQHLRTSASAPRLQQHQEKDHSRGVAGASHTCPKRRFQVGSRPEGSENEPINYSLSQKIFHSTDAPAHVREAKLTVQHSKKPNILGTEQRTWNQSTVANARVMACEKGTHKVEEENKIKQRLLKVRAGLLDEFHSHVCKPCKMHSDEAIEDRKKYIVAITGQGPIGCLSNKWFDAQDERGLSNHVRDDWPDWNGSHSAQTKEDAKQASMDYNEREERRHRMMKKDNKLNEEAYISPAAGTSSVNAVLRERKLDYQELKEQFKRELKREFPQASEERLQAMAQRLLKEKLLADAKMARFPMNHETFRPLISLTTQDRRYRVYSHPGTWSWNTTEMRYSWSCCGNFGEETCGCEYKVVNPDAWCLLGFERRPGAANVGAAR